MMGFRRRRQKRVVLTLALYFSSLLNSSIAQNAQAEASARAPSQTATVEIAQPKSVTASPSAAPVAVVRDEKAVLLADQILKASGGLEKLKEVYDTPTRAKGRVSDFSALSGATNSVAAEIISKRDKLRIELNVMGQPTITGYNGITSWMQQGDQVFPSDPQTTKRIQEDLEHGSMLVLRLNEPTTPMSLVPDKQVDGHLADGLKVIAEDGAPTIFYADKLTHLILRCEYDGMDFEQGLAASKAINFYDYKEVLGTQVAMRSLEFTNGNKTSESVTDSLVADPSVSDSLFETPKRNEIAGLQNGAVQIPFEITSNEILVKCRVNGGNEYRFIVDTGATQNVMDLASANSVGAVSKGEFSLTTGSGFMKMGNASLKTLELGTIKLENLPVAVADLPAFSAIKGVRPAGIIGANVLRRFLVTIDYDKKILTLADPEHVTVPEGAIVVQAKPTLVSAGLAVDAVLDGTLKLSLLVDTGAAFNNASETVVKSVLSVPLLPVGTVQGVEGNKIQIGSVQFKTISLGGVTVPDPVFSIVPQSNTHKLAPGLFSGATLGIMGNPFWSRFRLTIDYRNCRLLLEQTSEQSAQEKVFRKLAEINRKLVLEGNVDAAISALQELSSNTSSETNAKDGKSTVRINVALSQVYFDKALQSGKDVDVQIAMGQFNKTSALGREANAKDELSRLFASYAIYLLKGERAPDDRLSIRRVLQTASTYSETQPEVLIGVAMLMERLGNVAAAEKLLNDALFISPSNYLALIQRYEFARRQNKAAEVAIVTKLLHHYWAGAALPLSDKATKAMEAPDSAKSIGKTLGQENSGKTQQDKAHQLKNKSLKR